jgi:hypothetical protein
MAELQDRNPNWDIARAYQRRAILRRRVMAAVSSGDLDEAAVREKVIGSIPQFWT